LLLLLEHRHGLDGGVMLCLLRLQRHCGHLL
jgi:hypothetical protein